MSRRELMVVTLTKMECGECGVVFALSDDFIHERKRDRRTWYCPNGHSRWWPGKTVDQQLKEAQAQNVHLDDQLRAERRHQRELLETARRSQAALRGHLTRLKRRIAAGVCPWCHRRVKPMADHVGTMHPDKVDKYLEATT